MGTDLLPRLEASEETPPAWCEAEDGPVLTHSSPPPVHTDQAGVAKPLQSALPGDHELRVRLLADSWCPAALVSLTPESRGGACKPQQRRPPGPLRCPRSREDERSGRGGPGGCPAPMTPGPPSDPITLQPEFPVWGGPLHPSPVPGRWKSPQLLCARPMLRRHKETKAGLYQAACGFCSQLATAAGRVVGAG